VIVVNKRYTESYNENKTEYHYIQSLHHNYKSVEKYAVHYTITAILSWIF